MKIQLVPMSDRIDTFEVYEGSVSIGMVWRESIMWHAHRFRLDPEHSEPTREAAVERLRELHRQKA